MSTRFRVATDALTTLFILLTCSVLLWAGWTAPRPSKRPVPQAPKAPVSLAGAHLAGSSEAPVVIIEFADFQCTFCVAFERNTFPRIEESYIDQGKVLFAFRHHPIEQLHAAAFAAAETATCAGRQGKFWEAKKLLFRDPKSLDLEAARRAAIDAGANPDTLDLCLRDPRAADQVRADAAEATRLGLNGTPAFLVGLRLSDGSVQVSQIISGAGSFEVFRAAVDALLKTR